MTSCAFCDVGGAGAAVGADHDARAALVVLVDVFPAERKGLARLVRPEDELRRVDIVMSVASVYTFVDPIVGADLASKAAWLALKLGEPTRVARALSTEAVLLALANPSSRNKALGLIEEARALAREQADALTEAMVASQHAGVMSSVGDHQGSIELLRQASDQLTDLVAESAEARLALSYTNVFIARCLYFLDVEELSRTLPSYIDEAELRGNVLVWCFLTGSHAIAFVVADRPDAGRASLAEAVDRWQGRSENTLHALAFMLGLLCDLYEGETVAALARLEARFERMDAVMKRVRTMRVALRKFKARVLLAQGQGHERDLRAMTRELRREREPTAKVVASQIEATLAAREADDAKCLAFLQEAFTSATSIGLQLETLCLKWRLGQRMGGDAGDALLDQADELIARGRRPHAAGRRGNSRRRALPSRRRRPQPCSAPSSRMRWSGGRSAYGSASDRSPATRAV